ncbi:unnamed protein product, partial [Discosporangium mesarthrocarpum]
MIYVSGQTMAKRGESGEPGRDVAERHTVEGDAEAQTGAILDRIEQILKVAGSSKTNLVQATIHVRDFEEDLEGVDRAWEAWVLPGQQPPARTCLQT